MPSINRPSWRGVSTSSEDTTINYITERLRNLQESTRLIRDNLSNLIQSRDYDSTQSTPAEVQEVIISPNVETSNTGLPDVTTLTENVQEVLERNGHMKKQVEEVLQSNVSLKLQVHEFLEESKKWRDEFLRETEQLDARLEEVVAVKKTEESHEDLGESEGLLAVKSQESMGWLKSAGFWCSATLSSIVAGMFLVNERESEYPLSFFCCCAM